MALLSRKVRRPDFKKLKTIIVTSRLCSSTGVPEKDFDRNPKDDEFKPLRLMRWEAYVRLEKEGYSRRKFTSFESEALPPRYLRMAVDQHWPSVWPVAASFRDSVVPLPLYQGYTREGKDIPGRHGNLELMKIPNFLHLTPPAIKAHCAALKKFCTAYPEKLKQDRSGFPLEVITSNYCHSGPTIRDPKARIVTFKVKLSDLNLGPEAQEKMKRLLEHRYDNQSDIITITTDSCPMRKQNYDYAKYLLTALYHESQKEHPWESEKNEDDWLVFKWEGSRSSKRVLAILKAQNKEENPDTLMDQPLVKSFGESVTHLKKEGETKENIESYKTSLLSILQLPMFPPV